MRRPVWRSTSRRIVGDCLASLLVLFLVVFPMSARMSIVDVYKWGLANFMPAGRQIHPSSTQVSPQGQSCAPAPAGAFAWYPGDGNAQDVQGNNGTLLNGATFGAGEVGQAFSLDGLNDMVTA